MSTHPNRNGFKWTINELLALHKEFELKWSVEKIAKKHQRSINSINKKINDELRDVYVDEWAEYGMVDAEWKSAEWVNKGI